MPVFIDELRPAGCLSQGRELPALLAAAHAALDSAGLPIGSQVSLLLDAGAYPPSGHRGLEEAARCGEPAGSWTCSTIRARCNPLVKPAAAAAAGRLLTIRGRGV